MATIIQADGVSKSFRQHKRFAGLAGAFKSLVTREFTEVHAVREVSFAIGQGEAVGYLGPNGAGKSTMIKMLTGILVPSGGTVSVFGRTPHEHRVINAREIGVVFGQRSQLWWDLPVIDSFNLHQRIYRVDDSRFRDNLAEYSELLELTPFLERAVRQLSLGQRMRAEIVMALLHDPKVLFLDEPTIGLDPQTRSAIWRYIRALQAREGTTIFMTTHYMDEAEHCDRIAIIDRGEIVVLDTPEALKAGVGADRITLGTSDDDAAVAALRERFGIDAAAAGGEVTFHVERGEAFLPKLFAELGVPITTVAVSRPTLDDVFLRHTGLTMRDAETASSSDRDRAILRVLARSGR